MIRRFALRRAAMAILGGGVIAAGGAGLAWGYWLASDSSNPAAAKADSLQQGTTPTASVADATSVSVSWTAATTVGGHAATGYVVNRYPSATGGSPTPAGGTCAGTVAPLTCTDTGVYGDWYYTVTPKIGLWTGTESHRSLVARAASKLVFISTAVNGTASSSATLGPISLQIRNSADASLNAPVGGIAVGLVSSSSGAKFAATSAGPSTTSITVPAGSSTGSFYYGDTVAGTPTITVSATSLTSTTQNETITPASATSFAVSGFPTPQTAGVSGSFTVVAKDAFGNTATGYRGTAHFTSPDAQAVLPADYAFVAGDNGAHTFTATLKTAGSASITATDTASSSITGSQGVTVTPASASSFEVAGFPSQQTAGVAGSFTVTAKDAFGNTATGYRGTAHFTSSDAQAVLPGDYPFVAADNGARTFSATLKTAGSRSITVTDTVSPSITGAQTGITVNPSSVSKLAVSSSTTFTAGSAGSVSVTAQDQFGNTVPSYSGTVAFGVGQTDPGKTLPGNYQFVAGDNGAHTFTNGVTLTKAYVGTQSITVTDTVSPSITGAQTGITVNPSSVSKLAVSSSTTFTAGSAGSVSVTAQDQFGNTVPSYRGTVAFGVGQTDPGKTLPGNYQFVAGDNGTHTFTNGVTLTKAYVGTQSITATDTVSASITGSQTGITVAAAAPTQMCFVGQSATLCLTGTQTVGSGGTFTGRAMLMDGFGNTAVAPASGIAVTFSGSGDLQAPSPTSFTIPAGQSFAGVSDKLSNGTSKSGTLTANASALTNPSASVNIHA